MNLLVCAHVERILAMAWSIDNQEMHGLRTLLTGAHWELRQAGQDFLVDLTSSQPVDSLPQYTV